PQRLGKDRLQLLKWRYQLAALVLFLAGILILAGLIAYYFTIPAEAVAAQLGTLTRTSQHTMEGVSRVESSTERVEASLQEIDRKVTELSKAREADKAPEVDFAVKAIKVGNEAFHDLKVHLATDDELRWPIGPWPKNRSARDLVMRQRDELRTLLNNYKALYGDVPLSQEQQLILDKANRAVSYVVLSITRGSHFEGKTLLCSMNDKKWTEVVIGRNETRHLELLRGDYTIAIQDDNHWLYFSFTLQWDVKMLL